jgi:hypothetical protein
MCGAHDKPVWGNETQYYALGWDQPEEPYDQVDTVDFQGW